MILAVQLLMIRALLLNDTPLPVGKREDATLEEKIGIKEERRG